MEKYKYCFGEYIGEGKPLPEDANAMILMIVNPLGCEALEKAIADAQYNPKQKGFGDICVYDAGGALICSMETHYGVVKTFEMVNDPEHTKIMKPLRVIHLISRRNEQWSFRKEKRDGKGV